MTASFIDLMAHIEGKRYRAAAELMLQVGLATARQRDPAMIAAMIATLHRQHRQSQSTSPDKIKEQVLDRMVTLRWLKRDRLTWLYAQPHDEPIRGMDIPTRG